MAVSLDVLRWAIRYTTLFRGSFGCVVFTHDNQLIIRLITMSSFIYLNECYKL